MSKQSPNPIVDAAFGVFFIALAIVIVIATWETGGVAALVVALIVGLLGVEALFSAARGKRSLISRIGPLP